MEDGFDLKELTNFEKHIIEVANDTMPKESKKFLRTSGTKLRKNTLKIAKSKVKKDTGGYFKSIKRGKVYKYNGDELSIRCYSYAPHAHLIEDGHRQITKDGKEVGWVDGKHIFEEAEKQFENTFYNDTDDFLDEIVRKLLVGR